MGRVIEIKKGHLFKWPELKTFVQERSGVSVYGLMFDDEVVSILVLEQGRIYYIFTPEPFRRGGYAKELMRWAIINKRNSMGNIRTHADKCNVAAVSLLMSVGFTITGFTDIDTASYYLLEWSNAIKPSTLPYADMRNAISAMAASLYIIEALEVKIIR